MIRIVTSGALLVGLSALGCASNAEGGSGGAGAPSGTAGSSAAGAPAAGAPGSLGGGGSGGAPSSAGTANGSSGAVGFAGSGAAGAGSGSGGASAGSGGSAGAAGSASGGAAGTSGDSCAGLTGSKFCDNWDARPMGKPTGDFSVTSGVVVDTSKAYSGTQSLHFQKLAAPAKGTPNLTFTKQFPLASNDIHGRLMYFMTQAPANTSHFDFITSNNKGGTQWSIGGQGGVFELVCDPPDNGLDSKTKWPAGKWVCLQWEYNYPGNNTNTALSVKLDGVAVDKGVFTGPNSNKETWKAGEWTDLKFGWEIFGSSDVDVEFWIDDLAWGEQEIACPAVK